MHRATSVHVVLGCSVEWTAIGARALNCRVECVAVDSLIGIFECVVRNLCIVQQC